MYRDLILNFISQNFKLIQSIGLVKGTICLDYKFFSKELLFNSPKYLIYDFNLPIISTKFIDDNSDNAFLDFAKSLDTPNVFSKKEIDIPFLDLSNNKNILDLDFNYLYFLPLIKEDVNIGFLYLFGNNLILDFKFNKSSLTSLLNGLSTSYFDDLNKLVKDKISLDDLCYYQLKDNDKIVLKNIDDVNFNQYQLTKKTDLVYYDQKYQLYYCDKKSFNDGNLEILHISSLKTIDLPSQFSMLFFNFDGSFKSLSKYIKEMDECITFNAKYHLFSLSQDYYVLVIERKLTHLELSKYFTDNYLLITAPKTINNHMDLVRIVNYVVDNHPLDFDYQEYLNYVSYLGQDELKITEGIRKNKKVYYNNLILGPMVNSVVDDFKYYDKAISYENHTYLVLNKFLKNALNDTVVFVSFHASSINKRKFINLVNKFNLKNIKFNVILHDDKKLTFDELKTCFYNLYVNGVNVFVDKSYYFDFKMIPLLSAVKGIYLSDLEVKGLFKTKNDYLNDFIKSFNNKIILCDSLELTGDLNGLTYYVIK